MNNTFIQTLLTKETDTLMTSIFVYKIIHFLGTILFLGNIIDTGRWIFIVELTRNLNIVFAQHKATTQWLNYF
jgi:hypothetical protein